jgi:hypothetical protein
VALEANVAYNQNITPIVATEKEAKISHYWRRIESMLNPESHAVAVKEKCLPVRTPPWLP